MLFEELGFRYIGPVDGHDIGKLVETFDDVRRMTGPRLVHVLTVKGKGFAPAEADQVKWHARGGFDKQTGAPLKRSSGALPRYQEVFGRAITELGAEYPEIAVITAAMAEGTSTNLFAAAHPERFFDVGIAEGHAVTFAAGMATQGVKPVVAIYSTFLQRAYDSIVHDVALQELPVVFCMDRAGIAGDDGPTHHGGLDIAYMLAIPNMTVTAPKDAEEMIGLLRTGIEWQGGPFSVRWPRDVVSAEPPAFSDIPAIDYGTWEVLTSGSDIALLATGTMVLPTLEAASLLALDGVGATVVNCRFIKPLDEACLARLFPAHRHALTIEEGTVVNGFGAFARGRIAEEWPEVHAASLGLPDSFVSHGERAELLEELHLAPEGIASRARQLLGADIGAASLRETA
jgi:1-deoxy-D-xylulose-5-phosphate synthase